MYDGRGRHPRPPPITASLRNQSQNELYSPSSHTNRSVNISNTTTTHNKTTTQHRTTTKHPTTSREYARRKVGMLLGISIIMIIGSKQNSPILSLRFSIESNSVKNFTKHDVTEISTQEGVFCSELCLLLHAKGGGRWVERYYLLSNYPIPRISNYESGGLRLPRKLNESSVILLPVNQSTSIWIKKTIVISQIPQYPKVAYLSKHSYYHSS